MLISINRVILYVKNIPKVASFYKTYFGMKDHEVSTVGWVELSSKGGGCKIALHQAAKSQRKGTAIKIVFGVLDIAAFKLKCAKKGLSFGPIHKGKGFEYCNSKDPAGNSISISSRGLK
jgi:predicted enzyme related to lactoylglutathione lyase